MKNTSFYKDVLRTLKNNLARFIAITVMATLSIGVFSGFAAGCFDMLRSADRFYNKQNNYDIQIVSTLGLTNEDLSVVSKADGVNAAFGNVSMDVKTKLIDGSAVLVNMTTLDIKGMNKPYLLTGTLPEKSGQIAVNSKFIDDTGYKIGDTVVLTGVKAKDEPVVSSEDNNLEMDLSIDSSTPTLNVKEYIITAIVGNPLDISNDESEIASAAFSGDSRYVIYATNDCIKSDIYTAIYLTVNGDEKLDSYSIEYQRLVDKTSSAIKDTILDNRQQVRYDEVVGSAKAQIADGEKQLADKMTESELKMADAQKEIDNGWIEYKKGKSEIETHEAELLSGEKTFADAKKTADVEFGKAQKGIDDGWVKSNAGETELNNQESETFRQFADFEQKLAESRSTLDNQKSVADTQLSDIITVFSVQQQAIWNTEFAKKIWADMIQNGKKAAPYLLAQKQGETPTKGQTDAYNAAMADMQTNTGALASGFTSGGSPLSDAQLTTFSTLAVTYGNLDYSRSLLDGQAETLAAQKSSALKKLVDARKQIEDGKAKLISGQKELNENKAKLATKQAELEDGKNKLADAKKELADSRIKLTDGQKELDENRVKYKDSIAKAKTKLADAKIKVNDIGMAKWYVWDRSDNKSFAGLKNDMNFIRAVTTAFPVIFFLVAILICLTTMTRMVEEDRGLVGTYKSLGYRNFKISLKYILYAVLACMIGGILGSVIGVVALPTVIRIIFKSMYVLPMFKLEFYPAYMLSGFALFLLGIVGATAISCNSMLRHRPAELMRPKSPKDGSRILLERIPFIWKRLNFLEKVTCRNLFRYKKRAMMTIVGILGCTMLIVLGFGLRDTVKGLMPDQYDTVTIYDAIVVTDNLKTEEMNSLKDEWTSEGIINDALPLQISSMTLSNKSEHVEITVMVIPDDANMSKYIHLQDYETGAVASIPSNGIVVTKSAAKQIALEKGDTASLLDENNLQHDFPVSFVAVNYVGNYVFISESCYQATFGNYNGTAFLINMTDKTEGEKWLESLKDNDKILNVNSSQSTIDSFNNINLDMVIYLLIGMSAVLALAVLFTLSNINISERERELATIKVLGFQRKEVYSYVNKETVILSIIGILCGLPAGYGITYGILGNLSIADISFKVRVSPIAYLLAAILTLIFTLLVNRLTNKGLRKINMVEALKSVE
jgi:putative ABC transport system permease protein